MSLVLFYDYNQKTHQMIRQLSAFPQELITRFNDGTDYSNSELSYLLGNDGKAIVEHLDEQAKGANRALIMVEYARCRTRVNNTMPPK